MRLTDLLRRREPAGPAFTCTFCGEPVVASQSFPVALVDRPGDRIEHIEGVAAFVNKVKVARIEPAHWTCTREHCSMFAPQGSARWARVQVMIP